MKQQEIGTSPLAPEDVRLCSVIHDGNVQHDCPGDFILPDYMPEIRKIVSVTPHISPTGRFIGEGRGEGSCTVEFGGDIVYNVSYISDDGSLCGATLTSEYSSNAGLTALPVSAIADTRVESCSCRAVAPRRLAMKTRLRTRVIALGENNISEKVGGSRGPSDDITIERYITTGRTAHIRTGEEKELHASGSFNGAQFDEGKGASPVVLDAALAIRESKASADSVRARGEIVVRGLFRQNPEDGTEGENELFTAEVRIPIAEEINVPGTTDRDECAAWGACSLSSVKADGGPVTFEVIYNLEAISAGNHTANMTADMFSTAMRCDCTYKNVDMWSIARCTSGSVSLSETVSRQGGEAEVLFIVPEVRGEKLERLSDGKAALTGVCTVKMITRNDQGIASEDCDVPFRYVFDIAPDAAGDNMMWRCACSVTDPSARAQDKTMTFKGELNVAVLVMMSDRKNILESATLVPEEPFDKNSSIRVFYPEKTDTVWSIAKKYHVPPRSIDPAGLSKYIVV